MEYLIIVYTMTENLTNRTYALPDTLLKRLGKAAEDLNLSRQDIVAKAVEAYLDAIEKAKSKSKKND